MAVDFGPSSTQAPDLQSNVTPKEGVVKEPVLLKGLGDVFDQAAGVLKAVKKDKTDGIVAEFTRQQVLVADALEQGVPGMTMAAARTKTRKNFLSALEANPGLADELIKAHKAVVGTAGLGLVIDEGTKQMQRQEARIDQLVTSGLLDVADADNEAAVQAADELARTAVAAQEVHQERMRTLDLKLKTLSVGTAEYEAVSRERKEANRRYIIDTQPAQFNIMEKKFKDIVYGAGTEASKIEAINDLYAASLSEASARLGDLSTAESAALTKPFEMLRDNYIARASGELSDAEVKRKNERLLEAGKQLILQDPEAARAVATSNLFGDNALMEIMLKNDKLFTKISNLISGTEENLYSTDTTHKEATKAYIEEVTKGLESSDEATKKESQDRMSVILQNLVDGEGKIKRDPAAAFQPVKWISSSEFYQAYQKNPELFKEEMDNVNTVLTAHYADEVWGMVNREFLKSNVVTPGEVEGYTVGMMGGVTPVMGDATQEPTPQVVSYRTTSSGMEFFAVDPEDKQAITVAKKLNKDLKPIINETVRAFAHMDGRNDYSKYWEETAESFFQGQAEQIQPAGGDEGDDLSIESFMSGSSALDSAMSNGGFVGDGDFSKAETPMEVAAAFTGFTETEHKQVLSSFIENNFGTTIDPSETAWCAAFVNGALGAKGVKGTGKLNAKSFLNWGQEVTDPQQGDIVVFDRGKVGDWQGHVGFYVGPSDKKGYIRVLGGNQSNKVSIQDYPINRLEGYRRG